jgi:hypothetical protein
VFVWSDQTFEQARRLLAEGHSLSQVSTSLGVPARTIRRWRSTASRTRRRTPAIEHWRPPDDAAYAYVLGLYLGDGHITRGSPGSGSLRIALDALYPDIIDEAQAALTTISRDRASAAGSSRASAGSICK